MFSKRIRSTRRRASASSRTTEQRITSACTPRPTDTTKTSAPRSFGGCTSTSASWHIWTVTKLRRTTFRWPSNTGKTPRHSGASRDGEPRRYLLGNGRIAAGTSVRRGGRRRDRHREPAVPAARGDERTRGPPRPVREPAPPILVRNLLRPRGQRIAGGVRTRGHLQNMQGQGLRTVRVKDQESDDLDESGFAVKLHPGAQVGSRYDMDGDTAPPECSRWHEPGDAQAAEDPTDEAKPSLLSRFRERFRRPRRRTHSG